MWIGIVTALVGCGSEPDSRNDSDGDVTDSGADTGDTTGPTAEACNDDAMAEPTADVVYYVAMNDPGADDEACDGLAPTDEGGGRCPFRDLSSAAVRALLVGAGVRVEVREGTYIIEGWDGLRVEGTGGEASPLVLSAYPGEHPVIGTGSPDGVGCEKDYETNPACVRQVVRVGGDGTVFQGFTVQDGLGYDFEINGGANHTVRCNTFRYTADFAMRADQLKIDGEARHVLVQYNEFTDWHSQAIDMTDVSDVIVEWNDFHDPAEADGGATGTKFGSRSILIRNNTVHDLADDPMAHAFALGGTGAPHDDEASAWDVQVVGNRVWNVAGRLAQLTTCQQCAVEDNIATNVGVGVELVSDGSDVAGECKTAPDQTCLPNTDARIRGNLLSLTSDVFVVVESGQGTGLVGEDNAYCATSVDAAGFGWQDGPDDPMDLLDFAEWKSQTGTDSTSQVLPQTDPGCIVE